MVNITPAKHQYVSIVVASMLILAFSSNPAGTVQPHRAASVAVFGLHMSVFWGGQSFKLCSCISSLLAVCFEVFLFPLW